MKLYEEALHYHAKGRKGKIEVVPTKSVETQQDLSLAYSPGVAEPCRAIAADADLAYEYTAKGNLVAVVSNGTAVLGLGDIGPVAAKPVMEGKGVLFKKFSDIDVFDIELNAKDPDDVIRACEMLEPTFGGINLEDIKAPECFYIEEQLKSRLKIPVFHDDQHGTAVISGAAFLNALEIVGKDIREVKVVFCGGGAAAIACANLYLSLGIKRENMIMADSTGIIYQGRIERMNPYKERFAAVTEMRTIAEALVGADAFVGVSVKDGITAAMVEKMAKDPIVFAMANPDPEVTPEEVLRVRPDAIMATGRSDYPNQVNNVLGFPFIFRGALDTRATAINEEMKMAAVKALARLAKHDVPESVSRAYGGQQFRFGREYLIPKPFDSRVLLWVAPAVAEAAMKSGVARKKLDLKKYAEGLEKLLGSSYTVMRQIKNRMKTKKTGLATIVLPEGESPSILKAAQTMREEGIAEPILLGNEAKIVQAMEDLGLEVGLKGVQIIRPSRSEHLEAYAKVLFEKRQRKGITQNLALQLMRQNNYYGAMMLEMGHVDGLLNGITQSYPQTLRPAIEIIGVKPGSRLSGVYMMVSKRQVFWFADTTVNIEPSAEELADIAIQTAILAETFTGEPSRVAMLSFSNFGSNNHPLVLKVRSATEIARTIIEDKCLHMKIDGEMQADTALNAELSENSFPFNEVPGDANVLIFPDLHSGNIAYKLISQMDEMEAIGPILVGMNKPVFVLQHNSTVSAVVNMATITAMEIHARNHRR
jgi:malate dehydrogenase (oxaloacetate-decarboxylating)(NADP+)